MDAGDSRPIIQKAIKAGINFFDTTNMCSSRMSEEAAGRALRDFAVRDEAVLATKTNFPGNKIA